MDLVKNLTIIAGANRILPQYRPLSTNLQKLQYQQIAPSLYLHLWGARQRQVHRLHWISVLKDVLAAGQHQCAVLMTTSPIPVPVTPCVMDWYVDYIITYCSCAVRRVESLLSEIVRLCERMGFAEESEYGLLYVTLVSDVRLLTVSNLVV